MGRGVTTSSIRYDASSVIVEAALNALGNLGSINITRDDSVTNYYRHTIVFNEIKGHRSNINIASYDASIVVTIDASQRVNGGLPFTGTWTLSQSGGSNTTSILTLDATADVVYRAIAETFNISDCIVTFSAPHPY